MKQIASTKSTLRFTSILERSTNKLWGCHFRVPANIAKRLVNGDSRRVVCVLNDAAEYQCAMLPFGDGVLVISVNKQLRDTLALAFGDEVHVRLKRDDSIYGLPMPEELHELLHQDIEGNRLFHALTRGRQRTLLYMIGSVKDPEKRAVRAVAIVTHLKDNGGKIIYKQLNLSLNNRQR